MYVRFIVLAPGRCRPFGLFRAETSALDDPALPHWLREPIDAHFAWFNTHLARPFRRARGRRIEATALCWFRPEAEIHIARARELAWLLEEAGHPTAMVTSRHVGQIVYSDEHQVVAKPDPKTRLRA